MGILGGLQKSASNRLIDFLGKGDKVCCFDGSNSWGSHELRLAAKSLAYPKLEPQGLAGLRVYMIRPDSEAGCIIGRVNTE